jgi:hypothetical protein
MCEELQNWRKIKGMNAAHGVIDCYRFLNLFAIQYSPGSIAINAHEQSKDCLRRLWKHAENIPRAREIKLCWIMFSH